MPTLKPLTKTKPKHLDGPQDLCKNLVDVSGQKVLEGVYAVPSGGGKEQPCQQSEGGVGGVPVGLLQDLGDVLGLMETQILLWTREV